MEDVQTAQTYASGRTALHRLTTNTVQFLLSICCCFPAFAGIGCYSSVVTDRSKKPLPVFAGICWFRTGEADACTFVV